MKKVLVIAPYPYLPYFSGGQKFIAQFLEYFANEVNLTVISVQENDFSLVKNYRTIPLLKKSFYRYIDLSLVKKISNEIKLNKYDAIIWEHPYYAWLAFSVKKRTGIQTIIHTHNIEHQRFRSTGRWWWPLLKLYEKWSFKKADKLFFITPEDKDFAIGSWKTDSAKCIHLPFGITIKEHPSDNISCKETIRQQHAIAPDEKIILFNGLLRYKPNLDALKYILESINPLLLAAPSFRYKIIVCGKDLPAELDSLTSYADKNIIFAGFVENIETYFKAADIFLNPVQSGGGIKTKMVEAIAYGATVIATESGAAGLDKKVCGNKLVTVPDNDWAAFAEKVLENSKTSINTPAGYYETYFWGNIVKKIASVI
ncbi:MAG: glycosyltransferase family 4 protein [Chitinophagaceae bacterium]|nr:glycosyltransferase family 4 protein [Chitinophagaceae bacterium]